MQTIGHVDRRPRPLEGPRGLLPAPRRDRHAWKRAPKHYARLYTPHRGQVFAFSRHDPHAPFIRCPETGTIMRLSTYERKRGKRVGMAGRLIGLLKSARTRA